MTVLHTYADFICSDRFAALPHEVLEEAKRRVLDLLGVAAAGARMDFSRMAAELMLESGGRPESSVIGNPQKLPAHCAGFVNAAFGHALDLDDGHRFANLHPGVCAVPAALAVAESLDASGEAMLKAVVAAYDISARIGRCINPSQLKRGFHSTGTLGVFGAASAAAQLMRLTPEQTGNALALAAHGACGLMQFTMAKPLNPAHAVHQGILCARLAQKGAQGSPNIFEGKNGYVHAFADVFDLEALTRGLGEEFEIQRALTKAHACCRHAHTPLDVALELCAAEAIRPGDIASIHVATYPVAMQVLTRELHPKDASEAKFSLPVSLALGICRGQAGPEVYTLERIADPEVLDLAAKIEVGVSPEWEKTYPQNRGVTLTITTRAGKVFTRSQSNAKGEAELPFTDEELFRKFTTNAGRLFSGAATQRLLDMILELERHPARRLAELLATPDIP